ncbi:DNA-binding transcriptional LysR family regulator [Rhizobium petrolearium]|uniref:LysR family transcriptional regulator n=1 Tax=Neorhizobium petrolearium TaxID=515361 RepID=UPI001AE7E6B5|nr:LysR family transcriptional regulator [Neorhizobium petrolearium]MBP1847075.1 DNA-binding transcriptional LysR family regulator [Neorhizobium petrolearium]
MLPPRRFLPSFSLLSAFEAAARTGSVTAAANELGLTQSAVSRQISALENQLGVALFLRERQTIRLTLAGDGYAREVREALRRISNASLNLKANPSGGTLNLAILPFFGTRWLTPRIKHFLDAHPGIVVNLITRLEPFDFRFDTLDAAIHFGAARWPGAALTFLMEEEVLPACSPDFKKRHSLKTPADVLKAPLLHLNTRPDAWELWFTKNKVPFDALHGMLLDQFMTMVEAAAAGLGAALLPRFLISRELDQGLLVAAVEGQIMETGQYHLAYPPDRATYPPLAAFRDWIIQEVEQDMLANGGRIGQ